MNQSEVVTIDMVTACYAISSTDNPKDTKRKAQMKEVKDNALVDLKLVAHRTNVLTGKWMIIVRETR